MIKMNCSIADEFGIKKCLVDIGKSIAFPGSTEIKFHVGGVDEVKYKKQGTYTHALIKGRDAVSALMELKPGCDMEKIRDYFEKYGVFDLKCLYFTKPERWIQDLRNLVILVNNIVYYQTKTTAFNDKEVIDVLSEMILERTICLSKPEVAEYQPALDSGDIVKIMEFAVKEVTSRINMHLARCSVKYTHKTLKSGFTTPIITFIPNDLSGLIHLELLTMWNNSLVCVTCCKKDCPDAGKYYFIKKVNDTKTTCGDTQCRITHNKRAWDQRKNASLATT